MTLNKTIFITASRAAILVMLPALCSPVLAQSSLLIESLRPAPAPPAAERIEVIKDWTINCPDPVLSGGQKKKTSSCTMEPIAFAYKGERNIKRFFGRMIAVKGRYEPVFIIQTRLDLLLPGGITLQIDKSRPLKVAFRSCHATGCVIPFRLTPQIRKAFSLGQQMKLSLKTLNGKREHTTISLSGFTLTLKKLIKGKTGP